MGSHCCFSGGNNDQVFVVHCYRRLCSLSFIGRSRQEETAGSGGQLGSGANFSSGPRENAELDGRIEQEVPNVGPLLTLFR